MERRLAQQEQDYEEKVKKHWACFDVICVLHLGCVFTVRLRKQNQ